jgi:HSP20 family molecular chaperone IbpA
MTSQAAVQNHPGHDAGREPTRPGTNYAPPVDIVEKPTELVILADIPGSSADRIDIHFEDRSLIIHAAVEPRQDATKMHFLAREYGVGDFHRVFQVNEDVDAQKIRAEYRDGVLEVHLPKAEAILPRKIEVRSGTN